MKDKDQKLKTPIASPNFSVGLASLISGWQKQAEELDPKMDTIKTVNKARDLGRSEAIRTCIIELEECMEKAC